MLFPPSTEVNTIINPTFNANEFHSKPFLPHNVSSVQGDERISATKQITDRNKNNQFSIKLSDVSKY